MKLVKLRLCFAFCALLYLTAHSFASAATRTQRDNDWTEVYISKDVVAKINTASISRDGDSVGSYIILQWNNNHKWEVDHITLDCKNKVLRMDSRQIHSEDGSVGEGQPIPLAIFDALTAPWWKPIINRLCPKETAEVSPQQNQHVPHDLPSWLMIRKGQSAYTGDDGGGAETQTICRSMRDYDRFLNDGSQVNCFQAPRGILVTMESWKENEFDKTVWNVSTYTICIKASNGSWRGYTYSLSLQPKIPPGTRLRISTAMADSITAQIASEPESSNGEEIKIGEGTIVELIEQKPAREDSLKVRVITGSHTGRIVWMTEVGMDLENGEPLFWQPPR